MELHLLRDLAVVIALATLFVLALVGLRLTRGLSVDGT